MSAVALGKEITGQAGNDEKAAGYDWTAEDLDDVNVALDLEMLQVMITVSGWDGVVVMDIVI